MYKIEYLKTGHVFVLPNETAKELKERFPDDYKILEKNGKKFKDIKKTKKKDNDSIRDLVAEE